MRDKRKGHIYTYQLPWVVFVPFVDTILALKQNRQVDMSSLSRHHLLPSPIEEKQANVNNTNEQSQQLDYPKYFGIICSEIKSIHHV